MSRLVSIIVADDQDVRDRALDPIAHDATAAELLAECAALEDFRRREENLYHRVRALLFLHSLHRFHLPVGKGLPHGRGVPYAGVEHLLARRFEAAIDVFLAAVAERGPDVALCSALAKSYRELAFQTLADQVKRSVRSVEGNTWMFRVATAADQPLRVVDALIPGAARGGELVESTPVRMDFTHSGWSDIFFLGMDYPQGARVLNVSIDLAVRGRDPTPTPPIETRLRVLDRPVLRLRSVDLGAAADITDLAEVYDYARDYLGLIKAAVISAGLTPPSLEGSGERLDALLERLVGPDRGLEITSHVRGIPKGSRLAVSTNLLASLIALCMRATGQTEHLEGPLTDAERRLIVARAILGEWLGGSGGGWQDSGGLWPGIKRIEGCEATPGDPAHGVSRGRLLPTHRVLGETEASTATRDALQRSLVLVHGGMAQNVGPILEMVTEKYLLRSEREWEARREALTIYDDVLRALKSGDIRALGAATDRNFHGPIQTIIPQATNEFTERLIERVRERFGDAFLGFWMLGGMSGGGMGLLFDPAVQPTAKEELGPLMTDLKRELEHSLPFAMDPVVYDFAINAHGTVAELRTTTPDASSSDESADADPVTQQPLDARLTQLGFDRVAHEEIRAALLSGEIGLARNRLPSDADVRDAAPDDVIEVDERVDDAAVARGERALRDGTVATVSLAAGVGSRWTQGAGVVKALSPFCRFADHHRSFLDVHLAKSRRTARRFGAAPLHVVTTSHLTHDAIQDRLREHPPAVDVILSPGRSIGLRLVPTERDLRFLWEETAQQRLDEQAQKVRQSLQAALIDWARNLGEASDYRDNVVAQCLHPVGHFYEVPNLLRNGTLRRMLEARPQLQTLFLHNIDTLGADLDPGVLGLHLQGDAALSFEVVPRRLEDQGGGLARVDGRPRLVESLALPRDEDEYRLSYYNSMSTWIDVDGLLGLFGLTRADLSDEDRVARAVRAMARRLPTYVTLKDVKKRWGHGHEDVFPVTQFEKLWGDMSALPEARCAFFAVDRTRGQQLKDPAQLDGWLRDGSFDAVDRLCDWD